MKLTLNSSAIQIGIGLLGGMGFTMSIFITGLSYANNPQALLSSKTAILMASPAIGILAYLWLHLDAESS